MAHIDNTYQPVEPGVYVNRFLSIPHVGESTSTEKVAETMGHLCHLTGVPADELRRWWYETHNERLVVVCYPTAVEREIDVAQQDAISVNKQEVDGTLYYTIVADGKRALACVGYDAETGVYNPMRSNKF